jgi:hypothetical protein
MAWTKLRYRIRRDISETLLDLGSDFWPRTAVLRICAAPIYLLVALIVDAIAGVAALAVADWFGVVDVADPDLQGGTAWALIFACGVGVFAVAVVAVVTRAALRVLRDA